MVNTKYLTKRGGIIFKCPRAVRNKDILWWQGIYIVYISK
ncbi:17644_t:CDS:2 [Funneliformis caledonium]|uniref:17644_t:CDS:1 n=1 Tax=Funneliformis caledonium TaxID=1117310 RepID=A0A9N9CLX3_9GLOM|nr:17644_t:CDS:2 [Funneliformis caledonium]